MEEGRQKQLIILMIGLALGAVAGIVGMVVVTSQRPAPLVIEPSLPTATPLPTETPGPVRVYVSGAVARPAVYELGPGSIVADAIDAAGQFGPDAAHERLNMALVLVDGMHIHVPTVAEAETALEQPVIALPDAPVNALDGAAPAERLVNINTGTLLELETLPGIGPVTAKKIVEYRELHGPFGAIAGIMDVSGIGPATFEAIEELITVE